MSSINLTFVTALRHQMVDTVWRQWRALGASVTSTRAAESIVDPEVLTLQSLYLLNDEPRLGDVLTSWVRLNSSLLSIQRLRNLKRLFPTSIAPVLGELAVVGVNEAKDARWRSLFDVGDAQVPVLVQRSNKQRAVAVNFRLSAAVILQLRSGMGVGAKSDIIAFLCGTWNQGRDWASPSMISGALSYTPAAIRRALDDLARAKFVRELETIEPSRRGKRMYSAPMPQWKALLDLHGGTLEWRYWKEVSLFVTQVCEWAAGAAGRSISKYAADVEARRLLEPHQTLLIRHHLIEQRELAEGDLDFSVLEDISRKLVIWLDNQT